MQVDKAQEQAVMDEEKTFAIDMKKLEKQLSELKVTDENRAQAQAWQCKLAAMRVYHQALCELIITFKHSKFHILDRFTV